MKNVIFLKHKEIEDGNDKKIIFNKNGIYLGGRKDKFNEFLKLCRIKICVKMQFMMIILSKTPHHFNSFAAFSFT